MLNGYVSDSQSSGHVYLLFTRLDLLLLLELQLFSLTRDPHVDHAQGLVAVHESRHGRADSLRRHRDHLVMHLLLVASNTQMTDGRLLIKDLLL